MSENLQTIDIYTDGSCLGNPGAGGWSFVVYVDNKEFFSDHGHDEQTTNNRMEISAAIMACQYAALFIMHKKTTPKVIIHTDSNYVKQGICEWIEGWKRRGWMGSKGPVANKDLWERLDDINQHLKPQWMWVRAHNGTEGNEKADLLARNAAEKIRPSTPKKIYLNVSFKEKEEAKKQGAQWDSKEKRWFVYKMTKELERWTQK